MTNYDQFLGRARSQLTLAGSDGPSDPILWEHAQRVMISAEMITRIPELNDEDADLDVLRVIALYHDAGWAVQVDARQIPREHVLTRPTSDVQFELAAEFVESSLADHLPRGTLERAVEAIRRFNDRECDLIEAHVVCDADNLDQIGPLGLLQGLRRDLVQGRSLGQVLDTWHRQQEYHYWEARIRDGFRFEPVRKLAWRRLQALDPFMQSLSEHMAASDLTSVAEVEAPKQASRGRTET